MEGAQSSFNFESMGEEERIAAYFEADPPTQAEMREEYRKMTEDYLQGQAKESQRNDGDAVLSHTDTQNPNNF